MIYRLILASLVAVVIQVVSTALALLGEVFDVEKSDEAVLIDYHLNEFRHFLQVTSFLVLVTSVVFISHENASDRSHLRFVAVFIFAIKSVNLVEVISSVELEFTHTFTSAPNYYHLVACGGVVINMNDLADSLHARSHLTHKGDATTVHFISELDVEDRAILSTYQAFSVDSVHRQGNDRYFQIEHLFFITLSR